MSCDYAKLKIKDEFGWVVPFEYRPSSEEGEMPPCPWCGCHVWINCDGGYYIDFDDYFDWDSFDEKDWVGGESEVGKHLSDNCPHHDLQMEDRGTTTETWCDWMEICRPFDEKKLMEATLLVGEKSKKNGGRL